MGEMKWDSCGGGCVWCGGGWGGVGGGGGRAGRIRKQVYLKRCLPWKFTLSSILFLAGEKVMHVRFITAYLIKFL